MLLEEPILPDPLERLGFTPRDRAILALARRTVGESHDFGEALRALRDATERLIPAGRVYVLGESAGAPIIGSIVSGVGIARSARGIELVRVVNGRTTPLGTWSPR
jgi:hypothetical protein